MNKKLVSTFLSAMLGFALATPAMAQVEVQAVDDLAVPAAAVATKSRVYIVMMKHDPAVAYEGGVGTYKATKPGKGSKINPNSAHVKKYVRYLNSSHDAALAAVGAGDKIYSYSYALNGFAAVLTPTQVAALRARDDVVHVWQDEIRRLTTDSTPEYLGLTGADGVWNLQGKGEDVIVGIIDSGIWPEHPSFSDQRDFSNATGSSGKRNLAYGAPPSNWTGTCESGERWSQDDCNNKLIGARYYPDGFSAHGHSGLLMSDFLSARDSDGHGSHVAGTAAGNEGPLNTLNGLPVSGVAPRARIAVYKVCWDPREGLPGCAGSDSAAAIDQAVADGVDVINFSIGGGSTVFASPDDIAFLFAADAGVWVATSNGNAGPGAETTGTPAGVPWITAVGASQDNEAFGPSLNVDTPASIAGEKLAVEGTGPVRITEIPISADVVLVNDGDDSDDGSLNDGCQALTNDVHGKVALAIRGACSFVTKYDTAAAAGAIAIIVYNDGTAADRVDPITMIATATTIPGVMVSFPDGADMAAETGVSATLQLVSRENRIALFSSRGPNGGAPDVIKPDVAAPGVGIIAAETLEPNANNNGGVPYQSISGTSMASPHVAGSFALLKEAHPSWSAAMARSALMTSARQDLKKTIGDTAADPFDIGAGAIVPAAAFSPGVVYDAGLFDYAAFSCGNNFQIFSDGSCAFLESIGFSFDGSELNLASIGIGKLAGSQTVTRTVTSVSPDGTTFNAVIDSPAGIDVVVSPDTFTLDEGDTKTFTVEFTSNADVVAGEWTFGALTWDNGSDQTPARSPIAVRPLRFGAPDEVSGNGTAGKLSFEIGFGYSGDYTAGTHGLAPANTQVGNVADDPTNDVNAALDTCDFSGSFPFICTGGTWHAVFVDPGAAFLRVALFDEYTDGTDDLDLYVWDSGFNFQGGSGSPTSAEQVDVLLPSDTVYLVFVHGWQTDGADANYALFDWSFGLVDDRANMIVTAPDSATAGANETIIVDWLGLATDTKYLGAVSHSDGGGLLGLTLVDISTE